MIGDAFMQYLKGEKMNLYSNIGSFSGFVGWNTTPSNTFDTFSPSQWQPVSVPQISDYVPSFTPSITAQPSDYEPSFTPVVTVQPSDYVSSQPDPIVSGDNFAPPIGQQPAETTINGNQHYDAAGLQNISNWSKEEIIDLFKNINGTVTTVTEEGGTFHTYKSSAIPNREFTVSDSGNTFWTTYTGTPADGTSDATIALDTVNVTASDTITLSSSEMAAIINAQNAPAPQADDYVPAETAPVSDPSVAEPPQTETATLPIEPSLHGQLPPAIVPEPPVPTDEAATNAHPAPPAQADNQQQANGANQTENGTSQTENTPTDPLNQSIGAIGDAAAYADAALSNPHQAFLAEAEKFKNSASLKHDLASGFSQTIIEFEEGQIYDERRAYYANNREAQNEAVEKIRTDAAELTQKHGEAAGKVYAVGTAAKFTGAMGTAADFYELGDRIKTAFDSGNWNSVAGQISKMVATSATMGTGMTFARGIGLLLAGSGLGAIAIGTIAAVGISVAVSIGADYLDKQVSNSDYFNFNNVNDKDEYTDLVLVGNHHYKDEKYAKLEAQNITLIGNHHFQNLEINSENVTIIGGIGVENNFTINSPQIEIINSKEISENFMDIEQSADYEGVEINGNAAENSSIKENVIKIIEDPQSENSSNQDSDLYINWDYLEQVAAEESISPQDYLNSLLQFQTNTEDIPDPELIDYVEDRRAIELEKIFSSENILEDPQILSENQASYSDIFSQPEIWQKNQEII